MKALSALLFGASVLSAWLFWFPIRSWAFSLVPPDMAWLKVVFAILIGYFGGVGIPIVLAVLAFGLAMQKE